jgi:hypothetical protein
MSSVCPPPSNVVILFDPSDKHVTLDEDGYHVFRRFKIFSDVRNLLNTEHYGHIDLHVPTTFHFNDMRPYPKVYIHTYFMDDEETSLTNDTERQKIRDSIRICCGSTGEEYIERGVMEENDYAFEQGTGIAELLLQMDINRRDELLQQHD